MWVADVSTEKLPASAPSLTTQNTFPSAPNLFPHPEEAISWNYNQT
jgi:hypothetical protein